MPEKSSLPGKSLEESDLRDLPGIPGATLLVGVVPSCSGRKARSSPCHARHQACKRHDAGERRNPHLCRVRLFPQDTALLVEINGMVHTALRRLSRRHAKALATCLCAPYLCSPPRAAAVLPPPLLVNESNTLARRARSFVGKHTRRALSLHALAACSSSTTRVQRARRMCLYS